MNNEKERGVMTDEQAMAECVGIGPMGSDISSMYQEIGDLQARLAAAEKALCQEKALRIAAESDRVWWDTKADEIIMKAEAAEKLREQLRAAEQALDNAEKACAEMREVLETICRTNHSKGDTQFQVEQMFHGLANAALHSTCRAYIRIDDPVIVEMARVINILSTESDHPFETSELARQALAAYDARRSVNLTSKIRVGGKLIRN